MTDKTKVRWLIGKNRYFTMYGLGNNLIYRSALSPVYPQIRASLNGNAFRYGPRVHF